MRRIAIMIACLSLTQSIGASVQAQPALVPARPTALLYRQASEPASLRARELLGQAVALLRRAAETLPMPWSSLCERTIAMHLSADNDAVRAGKLRALTTLAQPALAKRAYLDSALARIDDALALSANDIDLLYLRARALQAWEEPIDLQSCSVRRRDRAAIDALLRVMQLDPSYEASQVAFELGILRTREHDFEGAARAYARSIEFSWLTRDTAVAHANLAEVTMLAGDPVAALPHYQRALSLAAGGRDYALSMFGMAVALDRLGEHEKAISHAAKAAEAGGRTLTALEADGVFFEPAYERHYYLALGHEALAQLMPEARALLLETARAEYQAFVAQAPEGYPYRTAAQADLEAVTRELTAPTKPSRTARSRAQHALTKSRP